MKLGRGHVAHRKLFISHSWSYSERYTSMVSLLDSHPTFTYSNYSVPEDKAFEKMSKEALKDELRGQIRPVQCVVIIAGMWANHSDWIDFETSFSSLLDKPILAVRPRGGQRMPQSIINAATEVVNWNTNSIVDGILRIS